MRIPLLSILFLFFVGSLFSEEFEEKARQAEVLAEIRRPQEALSIYYSLLKEAREPWQKQRLLYNIGTVYLKENAWKQALKAYKSVGTPTNPQLEERLAYNTALAYFGYQQELERKSKPSPFLGIQIQKMLGMIRRAQESLGEPPISTHLHQVLLSEKLQLIEALQAQQRLMLSPIEAIAQVDAQSAWMQQWLKIANSSTLSKEEAKMFVDAYLVQDRVRAPLWKVIEEETREIKPSHQNFLKALSNLRFQQAAEYLVQLREEIEKFRKRYLGEEPISELVWEYSRLLADGEIEKESLDSLRENQHQLKGLIELSKESKMPSISYSVIEAHLNDAEASLSSGFDAFERKEFEETRFFLQNAAYLTMAAWEEMNAPLEPTPVITMEAIVKSQKSAIDTFVGGVSLVVSKGVKLTNKMLEVLRESQKVVLMYADGFPEDVVAFQEEHYSSKKSCQGEPWARVLPLFFEGTRAADEALNLIQQQPESFHAIQKSQNYAFENFQEAYSILLNLKNEADQPEKKPTQGSSQKKDDSLPIQDVLQVLRKMDKADRPAEKSQRQIKKVEKPW